MKLHITIILTVIAAMMAAVLGCVADNPVVKVPEANLFSVTVNNVKVPVEQEAILGEDWDDEDIEFDLSVYDTLVVSSANTVGARIVTEASPGARVQWGKARGSNRPDNFNDHRVPANFTVEDYLYFKVTADDGVTCNYYRFNSFVASPVKELASITIAGRDPNTVAFAGGGEPGKVPPPAADFESVCGIIAQNTLRGQIDLTRAEGSVENVVAAEPQDSKAQVRFAVAATAAEGRNGNLIQDWKVAEPKIFVDEVTEKETPMKVDSIQFADGNILFVEVTAQDKGTNYYGFQVTSGRIATVARLDFDGLEVTGKGTQASGFGAVTPGAYASADQQPGGFAISITPDDPEAKVDYALITSTSVTALPTFGTPEKIEFQDGNALAIRVQSARSLSNPSYASDTRYYKVGIELLSAKFLHQPKPAAYYYYDETEANYDIDTTYAHIDVNRYGAAVRSYENKNWYTRSYTKKADGKWYDASDKLVIDPASTVWTVTAEALDFELDRPVTGATYQWYESNSLYGGYGFDRDGRIYGENGYGSDITGGTAEQLKEQKDLLGSGLDWDEKTNISLHNGGNMYYRLPIPGRPIPAADGGTNETYTPKFHYRPFLTGFTSEVHYYWVVVTDSKGQKATSQRAVIVSERSSEKKHYNVDLNAYLNVDAEGEILPGTIGLLDPPRNAEPYKAGNHGDKYLMRISFPPGFDIYDYTTVTAQAIFYLRDGREWIQNWTQGDFGFENDGSPVVLWYNLTNDNATRGLGASGNEPSGGGLNIIPSHLVVKPAGTKPLNEMPPFTENKDSMGRFIPLNNNNAQGWFTPYIEIVDLRFEGPVRAKPVE